MSYVMRSWTHSIPAGLAAMVTLALLGLTATSAVAQQAPADAAPTVKSADVPDAELEQFTLCVKDVLEIRMNLEAQLKSTQDEAQAEQLKQKANAQMTDAVKSHGVDIDRFNQIARSLSQDAELNKRFQEKRQEPSQEKRQEPRKPDEP